MSRIYDWNVSRSTIAATIAVFSNRVVHSENGRFVVTIMLPRSLRLKITGSPVAPIVIMSLIMSLIMSYI